MIRCVSMVGLFSVFGALATGCASTATRSVDGDGMWLNSRAGTIAIGSVDVTSSPIGEESALVRYEESSSWLEPSVKLRSIRVHLTGTNTTCAASDIVKSICGAFVNTAEVINSK